MNSINVNNQEIIFKSIGKQTINLTGAKVGAIPKEIFEGIKHKNMWLEWQNTETKQNEAPDIDNDKNKRMIEKLKREKENVLAEAKKLENELTNEEKEELNQYLAKIDQKINELQPKKEEQSLTEQKSALEAELKELKNLGPKVMYERIDEIVELEDKIDAINIKMNEQEEKMVETPTPDQEELTTPENYETKSEEPKVEENIPEQKVEEPKVEEKTPEPKVEENIPEQKTEEPKVEEKKTLSDEEKIQKEAELKAYVKEKEVLFEKLSKYEKEVSPEKTKLLKELQEVEDKITNLKEEINVDSVFDLDSQQNEIEQTQNNEIIENTNESLETKENNVEEKEMDFEGEDVLKDSKGTPQQQLLAKKLIIEAQIDKLKKLESPEAEKQIAYLQDHLKDLDKTLPNFEKQETDLYEDLSQGNPAKEILDEDRNIERKENLETKKTEMQEQIKELEANKNQEAKRDADILKDNLKDINQAFQPAKDYEDLNHIEPAREPLVEPKTDKQFLLDQLDEIEKSMNDVMNNLKNIVKSLDEEKTKH